MTRAAMFSYAWDLVETGIAEAVAQFRDLGLDTVTLAAAYHAGKFLRPHGKAGKVYFPEDGTVYFHTDASRYGVLQPVPNALLDERDVLAELTETAGIATNAWLVLLHNSRLGLLHPEICVENAFGDRYIYNLCPSHPAARAYAVALVGDVTEHYAVGGVSLESPGFAPYGHGYHHEFSLLEHNRWLDNHLGLCFCEYCRAGAKARGIDANALRTKVATDVSMYLDADFEMSADMAEAFWLADVTAGDELAAYLAFRGEVVTSLVAEIRDIVRKDAEIAVIPSVARPTGGAWYEGTDLAALAESPGIIEACFYEPSAERVAADLFDIRRRMGGKGKLRGILRPAFPDLARKADFLAAVATLRQGGVEELGFYNFGHLRRANLNWIGDALREAA